MLTKKQQAILLRKQGKSYSEIRTLLCVAKSTLSLWLRDVPLSQSARKRLAYRSRKGTQALIKRNKQQTTLALQRALVIRRTAEKTVNTISRENLFLMGVALYWAEGYKRGAIDSKWKCVDFVNSDPKMIAFMMQFFRMHCSVSENTYKIQLMLHEKQNISESISFWSTITKLPKEQFMKPYVSVTKSSKGTRSTKRLPYGTVHIRIYDVKLFFRIIGWIDGVKKQIE